MTGAILLARVSDRPGALERLLGLARRRMLAVNRLSVGFGDGTLDVVLRLDPSRTSPGRARAELLGLADVEDVTAFDDGLPGRTRELALADIRPDPGVALPTECMRLLSQESGGVTVEITGTPDEVDATLARLRAAGLLFRSTRSGEVILPAPTGSHPSIPERQT